ncbi:MAG: enoyl-CoA hydratase/isomerase family protein [Candidatus Puniceispirillum sp.]|nr:enoyl-CoA hydratase/isomerase family protein [Candidatus Puniceispirillum sp.]MBL6774989.1 enoyl-CoA hydratase/isomerase family protein [Candidatus Puniceispirillum sp.]
MSNAPAEKPVIIEHKGGVTSLKMNRPDRLNAVNADLIEGLLDGLDEAVTRGASLVVLTGVGRAFSAGFDLSGLDQQSDAELLYRFVRVEELLQTIYRLPIASAALVQGRCFGAAADIVASCRHRVATPDSSFRMPGLQFGIVLGTRRLARLIGDDAALDLLETSRIFTADEAAACGFVTDVMPIDHWPDHLEKLAKDAADLKADAKAALLAATRDDTCLDHDLATLVRSAAKPGLVARIQAFVATQVKK